MSTEPAEVVSATVELTFANGRIEQLQFDNTDFDQPIYADLKVENDVHAGSNGGFIIRHLGERRSIDLRLIGRGNIPTRDRDHELEAVRREERRKFVRTLREKARWHRETGSVGDATLSDLADALEEELAGPDVSKEPQQ